MSTIIIVKLILIIKLLNIINFKIAIWYYMLNIGEGCLYWILSFLSFVLLLNIQLKQNVKCKILHIFYALLSDIIFYYFNFIHILLLTCIK